MVVSLLMVARLQEDRENWAEAVKARREVVIIRERQPDQKDWRIADARRALADLDQRSELSDAQRQRLKEANRLERLQRAQSEQRKYAEGIETCRKVIQLRGELLGESHPQYAGSLNNLAALYQNIGDYSRAGPLYRHSLEIKKRTLGENHPVYAQSLNNLALLYQDTGDYTEAEPLFCNALEIRKRAAAPTTPTMPPA